VASMRRSNSPLYLSLAAHGLFALLLVPAGMRIHPRPSPAPESYQIAMLEVAGGSAIPRSPLLFSPHRGGKAETERRETTPRPNAAPQKHRLPKAAGSQFQTARAQDQGSGPVAGNGSDARDATFAFPVFSPKPPVTDRALLPSSDRQVVLDVKLNPAGEVVDETLVAGIGNALDQLALNTVKSWKFQPATVNGQPVSSEAEVIFTFGPHYPTTSS
jgi:TonB family protein